MSIGANKALRGLAVQAATRHTFSDSGRLLQVNSPDRTLAPRMWMGGSAHGNVLRVRADVRDELAQEIEALVAREPPLVEPEVVPVHKDEYARLLGADAPVEELTSGITYLLPTSIKYYHDARIVTSETDEGRKLLSRFEAEGMPDGLVEMGFEDATHLWPPWCVALEDGDVASVAFAARLAADGAELGVATPPRCRGRRHAAATTAAWAGLPALAGRILFYSTEITNVSSQRVADRLGLRLLGAEFAIR